MSIGALSSGSNVADVMKLLESAQNQNIDLAKRLVKMSVAEKVQSVSADVMGLGQNFDTYA